MSDWIIMLVILAILQAGTARAQELQDPTKPARYRAAPAAQQQEQATGELQLESIIYSAERRRAVINGQSLSEGDRIGEALLQRIDRYSVVVRLDGENRVLQLNSAVRKILRKDPMEAS